MIGNNYSVSQSQKSKFNWIASIFLKASEYQFHATKPIETYLEQNTKGTYLYADTALYIIIINLIC